MKVNITFGLVLLLPFQAFAAEPCTNLKTTIEINYCIFKRVEAAEKVLAKYLKASRRRFAEESKTLAALDKAQEAWVRYRKSHCDAIYEMWSEGTIRGAMHGQCLLEQTRRRTHDLHENPGQRGLNANIRDVHFCVVRLN